MRALVGRFPPISPLHSVLSSAELALRPKDCISWSTHYRHVFLILPLHLFPTTSPFLQLTLNQFCLFAQDAQTSETTSTDHVSQHLQPAPRPTSKRLYNSSLAILSLRLAPHIHLTIIRSILSNLCISSVFTGQVSLP
jgi:hypothetical protein